MVVVTNNDVNAVLLQMGDELDLGDATIGCDQERKALVFQTTYDGVAEAVPSFAIGEIDFDPLSAQGAQGFIEQRRAGDAVHVEIPLDEDLFALVQGTVNARDGLLNSQKLPRGMELGHLVIEQFSGAIGSAGGQDTRQRGRTPQLAGDLRCPLDRKIFETPAALVHQRPHHGTLCHEIVLGVRDHLHEARLQACGLVLVDRAARGGFIRCFGQLGQERLGLLFLAGAQVLANLPDDLPDGLLALEIAQAGSLALP
ncbi:hypothetical protein HRbin07_00499 [bacterium HR07]|nr:hypothetical protein HRbin07_00499 [bacterium HR07]